MPANRKVSKYDVRRVQDVKTPILRALAGSLFVVTLFAANPSQAVTVDVRGVAYDVTTVRGTFTDLISTLEQQVWYGDQDLALDLVATVGPQLVGVNGNAGPIFAFDEFAGDVRAALYFSGGVPSIGVIPGNNTLAYAIASKSTAIVPLPAPVLLLLTALTAIAAFRLKRD
ncbi:MAG: hypothetical protein AAGL24_16595 [Pseudomonadota bacterium]